MLLQVSSTDTQPPGACPSLASPDVCDENEDITKFMMLATLCQQSKYGRLFAPPLATYVGCCAAVP